MENLLFDVRRRNRHEEAGLPPLFSCCGAVNIDSSAVLVQPCRLFLLLSRQGFGHLEGKQKVLIDAA
jgi:hypothetical protein